MKYYKIILVIGILPFFAQCSNTDQPNCGLIFFQAKVAAKDQLLASADDCSYFGDFEGSCLELANLQFSLDIAQARIQYNECLGIGGVA